jgi:hypothetical protein
MPMFQPPITRTLLIKGYQTSIIGIGMSHLHLCCAYYITVIINKDFPVHDTRGVHHKPETTNNDTGMLNRSEYYHVP